MLLTKKSFLKTSPSIASLILGFATNTSCSNERLESRIKHWTRRCASCLMRDRERAESKKSTLIENQGSPLCADSDIAAE